MSEDNKERFLSILAKKLSAMLDEKLGELGEGVKRTSTPDSRAIVHLFGIAYAHNLDGLEDTELMVVAARAGYPAPRTSFRWIKNGRDLAQYVEVKKQAQVVNENERDRYKVIETGDSHLLESYLNEEIGWILHSVSVGPDPAHVTTSQKVVIIAVLEREAGR